MKKISLVIAIAVLGFTITNASVSGSSNIIKNDLSESGKPGNTCKTSVQIASREAQKSVFTCTVTVQYMSSSTLVTMSFTGNTCTEAWATAKKVTGRYK